MCADLSELPLLPGYGEGVYRRRIRLEARPGRVLGELQDDFHHFAVVLHHDGRRVGEVRGGGLRVPWTACNGAVPVVGSLRGLAVGASGRAAAAHSDPRRHCTHLFDLAALAAAHAGRQGARAYDVSIPDRRDGRTRARLDRDGHRLLEWDLAGDRIEGPPPFAGRAVSSGQLVRWADEQGEDPAEAIRVLRRAVFISMGRRYDFERMSRADAFATRVGAACHTFSPERVQGALRNPGTCRDFGADPDAIFTEGFSAPFRAFEREVGA